MADKAEAAPAKAPCVAKPASKKPASPKQSKINVKHMKFGIGSRLGQAERCGVTA
jgi:hypothetical protein